MAEQLQGPLEKSPYSSESELRWGAVTVSFSNKLSPRTFQAAFVDLILRFATLYVK
jgi:hypothetical protein